MDEVIRNVGGSEAGGFFSGDILEPSSRSVVAAERDKRKLTLFGVEDHVSTYRKILESQC